MAVNAAALGLEDEAISIFIESVWIGQVRVDLFLLIDTTWPSSCRYVYKY